MSVPATKKLSIENYLDCILAAAKETGDKLIISWTKDLVTDICNEYGLCKICHDKKTRVIYDRRYIVETCACNEKLIGNW